MAERGGFYPSQFAVVCRRLPSGNCLFSIGCGIIENRQVECGREIGPNQGVGRSISSTNPRGRRASEPRSGSRKLPFEQIGPRIVLSPLLRQSTGQGDSGYSREKGTTPPRRAAIFPTRSGFSVACRRHVSVWVSGAKYNAGCNKDLFFFLLFLDLPQR